MQLLNIFCSAADIVFIVKDKPHSLFTREGHDLIFRPEIPLIQVTYNVHVHVVIILHIHTIV